jgi:uncharacterized protein
MNRHNVMHICLLLLFISSPAVAEEKDKVMKVSGTGVVSAKPDRARVHMDVSYVDRSIVSAKKKVDEKVIQIQKMLLRENVKPADMNTSNLSVYEERNEPVNRDGSRDVAKQDRYRVSREITVKIENISKLDIILDNALNLGTSSVRNIEFYSSRIDEIKFEAIRKASEDARKKADFLAKQFGCRVGKIQQIEYDYKERESQPYLLAAGRAGAPSFLQGTIDVTATINVVYQIDHDEVSK